MTGGDRAGFGEEAQFLREEMTNHTLEAGDTRWSWLRARVSVGETNLEGCKFRNVEMRALKSRLII